jgi:hypothetical protein
VRLHRNGVIRVKGIEVVRNSPCDKSKNRGVVTRARQTVTIAWIEKKWGIRHITISPYNSQANGAVERPHWDIRQMLYKATGPENTKQWYWFLHAVLWADRVSIRKRLGCSPYFILTGAHPILPLDAQEATWLVDPPSGILTKEELIGMRARALAKHRVHVEQMRERIDKDKLIRIQAYEKDFEAVIKDYKFKPGDLVLMRNTAIEKSLDKKMKPRYNGPMIVVRVTKNESYILAEMTGAVLQHKVAKFRVIPYYARRKIEIPDGILKVIDLVENDLERIEAQPEDDLVLSRDFLMDGVKMNSDILEENDLSDGDNIQN